MTDNDYWVNWYRQYDDPNSSRSRRLRAVQDQLRAALTTSPPGPIRLISFCAGDGRDTIPVLASHPRGADVRAVLVEKSPELGERASQAIARSGLHGVEVLEGDAALTSAYQDYVPANVALLCGVFGSVAPAEIEATIREMPHLCGSGSTVIWTKGGSRPDLREWVRVTFVEVGFTEVAYCTEGTIFAVGSACWTKPPRSFRPDRRLFTFRARTLSSPPN